ncbi:hypothetical protein PROFUN_16883 [Planoprotostelium fungivorum]|uniref:Uncharacterized protein n=1 Tax=Planoprotostelium fungivorum TaxID=1890364 RepID=A0A2P6MNK9_9EUKA|nr:hypothetical protein PROFUN_16883 [Planoprotostelium fungivorum]
MSLEVQLEEMQKELENKIDLIRKQMIVIQAFNKNWTKLRSTITALIWSPVEVLETLQQKIRRIKIGTHRERGTKQTTEQRPEKKPDFLNMDGDDVTRAVMYWMTTCQGLSTSNINKAFLDAAKDILKNN